MAQALRSRSRRELLFQIFDAAGVPVGGRVQASSPGHLVDLAPSIACDHAGNIALAYTATDARVYLSLFDTQGTPILAPTLAIDPSWIVTTPPDIARAAGGDILLGYTESGFANAVAVQYFTPAGAPNGFLGLGMIGLSTRESPSVAMAADGRAVVAWLDEPSANGLMLIFNTARQPIGPAIQFNDVPGDVADITGPGGDRVLNVAMAADGIITAVWVNPFQRGEIRRFDGNGTPLGSSAEYTDPLSPVTQTLAPSIAVARGGTTHAVTYNRWPVLLHHMVFLAPCSSPPICGDCDQNGVSNILDALRAAQISTGLLATPAWGTAAFDSCNTNGPVPPDLAAGISVLDALDIARADVGLIVLSCC